MTGPTASEQKILDCAAELGLTISSKFVPWSKSRNKNEKYPSLNWIVSLRHKGIVRWEGDYNAGAGHCPSYPKSFFSQTVDEKRTVEWECEHGKKRGELGGVRSIEPDLANVLSCLVADAEAIEYANFEEWAADSGLDTDSRKAEKIYNECVKTGLALRSALGEDGLKKLREACQDY